MFVYGKHLLARAGAGWASAAVLATLLTLSSLTPALAGEVIGGVRTLTGTVTVLRQDEERPIAIGDPIELMDEVRTGPNSTVGVILDDETRLSLGPNSALVINAMVYAPAADEAALSVDLLNGTLSYISGAIATMRPDAVRLTTPNATIGIRGTRLAIRAPAE
jgi:hypothetical protein